jgi:hypothetical protein
MIVNGFKILRFNTIPWEIVLLPESREGTSHDVFDEHGVVKGPFGDVFLVGPLKKRVNLRAYRRFHYFDDFLDPEKFLEPKLDPDDSALIMRAVIRDFLGTRAYRGHGHFNAHDKIESRREGPTHETGVGHEPGRTGDRGVLLHEIRKFDVHVSALRVQLSLDFLEDFFKLLHADFVAKFVEDLDESTHVGPLEIVGKIDEQVKNAHGVLPTFATVFHRDGIPKTLDPHLVDGDVSSIGQALNVGHFTYRRVVYETHFRPSL